jgi:LCP family protein required for cell wall assembly
VRYNLCAPPVTTPDLEPTQRIPIQPEPDAYDARPPRPPSNVLGRLVGGVLRLVLIVLIAFGALSAVALFVTPTRESILILGSDARPDELKRGEVGRTDTLLVFVADRTTPRVGMISLPRDLWIPIPSHGEERINAAYELGGSQTAKQTVSNVLGQRIDRYVLIGLQGVRDIVDAVGGVDITVATAIHDDQYPTDDYGIQTVDIPAGRQHMDGDLALKYARTRHQDSDFGRIARQQQVLAAVRNAMLNPLNWPRIPAVATAVTQSLKTDVSPLDLVAVGAAMLRDPGDPDRLVVDTSLVTPYAGDGGAFLLDPKPELKPTVARFLAGDSSAPPASVEVLNGAGVAGLAARTADRLSQQGFTIANVADAPRTQTQTTIVSKPAARQAAQQIGAALGVPTSRITESTTAGGTADVQVTLGADAR